MVKKKNDLNSVFDNKKAIILATVSLLIYLIVYFSVFFYNKAWNLNGSINNFKPISIDKGDYVLAMDYVSEEEVFLACFVETKDQKFIIQNYLLEPSNGGPVSVSLNIPYSVRNGGLSFAMISASGNEVVINSLSLKYAGTFYLEFLSAIVFIALLILITRKCEGKEAILTEAFTSISFLILHDAFILSPIFLIIYASLIALYVFRKINVSPKLLQFLLFYSLLLCVMCFFSPVSPLFTRGICADSGAYYTMGKGLLDGYVPYRDMFDHKGPLLYLLYLIGYMICPGGVTGVYFIEVLFMTLGVYAVYLIASKYMDDNLAYIPAFVSFIVFFNRAYTAGGTEPEQWYMGLLVIAVYYLISDNNKPVYYFINGLAFTLVFYTKFNVAVAYLVIVAFCGLRLLLRKQYKDLLKAVGAYIGAFGVVTLLILIYFAINNSVLDFINTYFRFNLLYSEANGTMLSRIIPRIYGFYTDNKLICILSIIGIVGFAISDKFTDIYGKLGIIFGFICMIFAVLCGDKVYNYYYCNIGVFAVFGIIVILTALSSSGIKEFISRKSSLIATFVLFTIITFGFNDMILSSDLVDLEPKAQDIIAHEMKMNARADASFIEWDMLEVGIFPAMDASPKFKYFYIPNIRQDICPEPYSEMIRYGTEGGPEYIVAERYSKEDYLEGDMVANYELMSMYETQDGTGKTFMIYHRR